MFTRVEDGGANETPHDLAHHVDNPEEAIEETLSLRCCTLRYVATVCDPDQGRTHAVDQGTDDQERHNKAVRCNEAVVVRAIVLDCREYLRKYEAKMTKTTKD